jgi:N-terminal acetyltransferase B complex non-catalytic subunit
MRNETLTLMYVQLTADESALYHYAVDLADWLGPHHDYVRPPPEEVLAEASRLTELKTGLPLRGVELPPKNGVPTNGHAKKEEDAPPVKDAPSSALEFYDSECKLSEFLS